MTYTKGPWKWQAEDECLVGPDQIVMFQDEEGRKTFAQYPDGTTQANANLIAAAPELLEALKELYNAIDSCVDLTPEVMQKCSKALNKAKGNTQ